MSRNGQWATADRSRVQISVQHNFPGWTRLPQNPRQYVPIEGCDLTFQLIVNAWIPGELGDLGILVVRPEASGAVVQP